MGSNITSHAVNLTDNSTQSFAPFYPPFRPNQNLTDIEIQLALFGVMSFIAIILNIRALVILNKRCKTVPYVLLQNIAVVDLLTPIMTGPFFMFGLLEHKIGAYIPVICNIQGFFHATLCTVFVNSVSLIAMSRYWASSRPATYHRIFPNKVNVRILLLALWSSSALICVPPLNKWGTYRRYDGTCWLAWLPKERGYMAYNVIMTLLEVLVVSYSCRKGYTAVKNVKKVAATASNRHQQLREENGHSPESPPTVTRINTDVFFVALAQLFVYIVLWVPLTVMNGYFLKDWRIVDFRIIISFLFLFFSRSILNPIIMFGLGDDITCNGRVTRLADNINVELEEL